MKLDARAIGTPLEATTFRWTPARVALYHLGLGAGGASLGSDLRYVLEDRVRPLPTFATLTCFPELIQLDRIPGLGQLDLARVLHVEHAIELESALPATGIVRATASIDWIEEKHRGCVIAVSQRARWENGSPAWTNRYRMYARGARAPGLARSSAPSVESSEGREFGVSAEIATSLNQALLYRHSGDNNPLHLDPAIARAGGFDRPILQGLCTLGMVVKKAVDVLFAGDVSAVRAVSAKFTGTVTPGDVLRCRLVRTPRGARFAAVVDEHRVINGSLRTF